MPRRTRIVTVAALILAAASCSVRAGEAQRIEFADLASGKVQIIGRLGVPIGQVVRVEATVVSAEKLNPDIPIYRGIYYLAIHAINGVKTKIIQFEFSPKGISISDLYPNRYKISEDLAKRLKRQPAEKEVDEVEKRLLRGAKRSLLVYEEISFWGMPQGMPEDVLSWSVYQFGPESKLGVIQELGTSK